MDFIDWIVWVIIAIFIAGGVLALIADGMGKHPWGEDE